MSSISLIDNLPFDKSNLLSLSKSVFSKIKFKSFLLKFSGVTAPPSAGGGGAPPPASGGAPPSSGGIPPPSGAAPPSAGAPPAAASSFLP